VKYKINNDGRKRYEKQMTSSTSGKWVRHRESVIICATICNVGRYTQKYNNIITTMILWRSFCVIVLFFPSLELFLCSLDALLFHRAFLNTLYIREALNSLMDIPCACRFHDFTKFINTGNYHRYYSVRVSCMYLFFEFAVLYSIIIITSWNRHIINNIWPSLNYNIIHCDKKWLRV